MLAAQLKDLVTAFKVLQAMLTAYRMTITGQYLTQRKEQERFF